MQVTLSESPRSNDHLLLREMSHRVNNELAATIGFVSVTAAKTKNDETKAALGKVLDYLYDYASVYRALQMPVGDGFIDAAGYLSELCHSISRSRLRHKRIQLSLANQPLQLRAEQCWRLGMIVSELITNSARHAFGGGDSGSIRVELLGRGPSAECRVMDNGVARKEFRPGQGLKIIQSLALEMGGTVRQFLLENGTISVICFPLDVIDGSTANGVETGLVILK